MYRHLPLNKGMSSIQDNHLFGQNSSQPIGYMETNLVKDTNDKYLTTYYLFLSALGKWSAVVFVILPWR
jgi:hypothetical protein